MKKKWLYKLGASVLALSLVTACGTTNDNNGNNEDAPEAPLNQDEDQNNDLDENDLNEDLNDENRNDNNDMNGNDRNNNGDNMNGNNNDDEENQ